jgi:putative ABC transport system ATP-binding protein
MHDIIQFSNVSKRFAHSEPLLDCVDLSIAQGQFIAIIGESGCGKSTLLNMIAGLETIDGGEVAVAGSSMARLSEQQQALLRRKEIGFVFQAFLLLPYLNVEKNIALSLTLNGVTGEPAKKRVAALMARLGLTEHAQKMPRQLSGGQTQRVAVARALAHEPSIILADEPTGNLDEKSAQEVLSLFVQAVREERRTCVMVTHSTQVARQADVVLKLVHGKLVEVEKAVENAAEKAGENAVRSDVQSATQSGVQSENAP